MSVKVSVKDGKISICIPMPGTQHENKPFGNGLSVPPLFEEQDDNQHTEFCINQKFSPREIGDAPCGFNEVVKRSNRSNFAGSIRLEMG